MIYNLFDIFARERGEEERDARSAAGERVSRLMRACMRACAIPNTVEYQFERETRARVAQTSVRKAKGDFFACDYINALYRRPPTSRSR